MGIPLERVVEDIQRHAENSAQYGAECLRSGDGIAARVWFASSEKYWADWVHLTALTRLIGQAQELRAMTRSQVMQ